MRRSTASTPASARWRRHAIPARSLGALQSNLLRSHAAGVGDPLPVRAVRASMALRANVLAKGFSGIRRETLDLLIDVLNRRVHPVVPSRGSVGASGDLAPLAHLSLVLVGEGAATVDGERRPARRRRACGGGAAPVTLAPKEGLALINGTQPSTAVAALALRRRERSPALPILPRRCRSTPFAARSDRSIARIHDARPHAGQRTAAANMLALLDGSAINKSHEDCGRVQDAYSLRCAPQVHGAARDALAFARRTLTIEANAATDNPMVFGDDGRDRVRREFSRRPDWHRSRSGRHRRNPPRDHQRTTVGSAGESGAQ